MIWLFLSKLSKKNTVFNTKNQFLISLFFLLPQPAISLDLASQHFNQAREYWSEQKTAESVEQLLAASSLRENPLLAWKDLNLLIEIQEALVSYSNPISSIGFQLRTIFNQNVQIIWGCALFWFLFFALCCHFRVKSKIFSRSLFGFSLVWFISGGVLLYFSKHSQYNLHILQSESGMIPIRNTMESTPNLKIDELPAGLIVSGFSETETALKIMKPLEGWIEKSHLRQVMLKPRR